MVLIFEISLVHTFRLSLGEYWKSSNEEKFQLLKNIFEDSPWIVKRGLESTEQFSTVADLFQHYHNVFASATAEEKLGVLRAHPDLVGKAALQGGFESVLKFVFSHAQGRLTKESTQEQKGAGLGDLSDEEIQFFQEKNEAYKTKFGMRLEVNAILMQRISIYHLREIQQEGGDQRIDAEKVCLRLGMNSDAYFLDSKIPMKWNSKLRCTK